MLEGPREPVPEPGPPLLGEEGREARATVTILVGGRDEPTGLDPEAVRGLDERLREVARAAIERHGGQVESAPGGRVVGTFGVPRAHEDDALRAARAAVELLERTQADIGHGHATATRAGISTGEVVTAGSALSGEPVSLAARLEAAAGAGEILVDASTPASSGAPSTPSPALARTIGPRRLLALIPQPPPLARLPRSALVGREGELAQLRQAFDRVGREGTVHLFTVLGGAGIGKSRLAEEFASHVAEEATVLAGRCLSYGERITFSALREVVGGLTAARPLSEALAGEEDAALVAARVTEAIERAESNSALEEIFWAFRRLFESLARERPLVLLLEDVHWAEPTLLDFVDYLAERVRAAPMLLLCLARPELLEDRPAWGGGKRNVSSLFLERLSDAEGKRLVDALVSGLPDATRARVLGTAEGNPLFLEQLLAMVAERPASHGEIPIPPTVQAALAARLDRLGPGERAVLEAAAVVGKEFREQAVAALLPGEAEQFTGRHLDALVAKDLLRPVRSRSRGQAELRFAHGLIQQTTYRAIPKRARAGLHEGVAAWLEEALGSGAAEYAEKAGYHLEQAHLHRAELDGVTDRDRELARRAADLLASAGRRAFRRGDMPAAVDLLGRATSLLPPDDREGLALLPELGYALFDVGELERADTLLTHAIERGRGHGFLGVELNATVMRAHAGLFTDPGSMDQERLSRDASAAVEGLDQLGDDLGLARACTLLFEAEWLNGRMAAATTAAERGAWHARRAGSRPEEAWAVAGQVQALLNGPMPAEEGSRRIDQLRRRAADNLVVDAYLLGSGAVFEAMTGSIDDARTHVAESCERLRDLGLKWRAGVHELLAGYIELLGGDPVAAERRMRAAKETFTLVGDRWFLSTVLVDLPRPLYEQARYAEARRPSTRSTRYPRRPTGSGRSSAGACAHASSPEKARPRRPSGAPAEESPPPRAPTCSGFAATPSWTWPRP